MARTADRRVHRTRRLLQEALIALILERGYAPLTVQDIIDRADVGRATFYAHFTSKGDLLRSLFDEVQQSLRQEFAGLTPATVARFGEGVGLVAPLFGHAAQHRRLYRALLRSREGASLLQDLRELLATSLRQHLASALARDQQPPAVPVELVVTASVSAVLGVLVWWLEGEPPYTPAELDRIIERLLAPGIAGTLELQAAEAAGAATARGARRD